jgi:DNA-binding PadR family transcriptional regulator
MTDDAMGREMRKGFLKMIVLKIISKKPIHGYDIINEIETVTRGHWVPSPGSIYPALDFLETKGYVSMEDIDRKKVYTITEEGKKALEAIDEKRRRLSEEIGLLFND